MIGTGILSASFAIFVTSFLRNTKQAGMVYGVVVNLVGWIGISRLFAEIIPGLSKYSSYTDIVSLVSPQGWAARIWQESMAGNPVWIHAGRDARAQPGAVRDRRLQIQPAVLGMSRQEGNPMRTLDVAWKDVSQLLRDWRSAAFLVGAPILFTLLMGVMMGGLAGSSEEDPRLAVGVLDRDGGTAAGGLIALLGNAEAVRPVMVDEKDADTLAKQVSEGKYAAAVIIPAGYTAAVFDGKDMPLRLLLDEASDAGSNADRAVRAAVFRLQTAVQTAIWSADIAAEQNKFASPSERTAFLETAVQTAVTEWESAPAKLEIRSAVSRQPEQPAIPSGFAQSSPGNMVTFALAGLIGAAEIIVWERKSGTLQRLLTTSISRMEILIGHFLAMFLLVFVQVILLGTFGQLIFGLAYWEDPGRVPDDGGGRDALDRVDGIADRRDRAEHRTDRDVLDRADARPGRVGRRLDAARSDGRNLSGGGSSDAHLLGDERHAEPDPARPGAGGRDPSGGHPAVVLPSCFSGSRCGSFRGSRTLPVMSADRHSRVY